MTEGNKFDGDLKVDQINPAERRALIMRQMRTMFPHVLGVARMYEKTYPASTTAPEVINAVTVAVPLPHFHIMTAVIAQVLMEEQAKQAAANDGTPA